LITIDTQRWDYLSSYGYSDPGLSPVIDDLGRGFMTHNSPFDRADKLVGELIEALASEGVLQNTIVILTSDHGQGLGENGTMGHGAILWESVIRVPLIITDFRTPAGNTVQERVGTIDIAPTIADFAGLDKAFDQYGRSLRHAASGELDPDQIYFAEVGLRTGASAEESWYYADSLAVYSGNLKQVSKRDKLELFETRAADNHLTPIAPDQISALAEYLAGLNEEFLAAESRFKNGRVSEADRDQLQGLGYTQ
jgi:arylsulfatase A-like enzyme